MTDFDLVFRYRDVAERLLAEGYEVSAAKTAFFIYNSKGTNVADVLTVDGLRGFLQGIQWAKEQAK
jgi:hypothetical protein